MSKKSQTLALSIGLFVSGCVQIVFWLSGRAPGSVGYVGAISTILSALLGFAAYRDSIALEVALKIIKRTAEDSKRGRRLSPDQMEAIETRLAGVDLSGVHVCVSYLPGVTDADTFARSLVHLLGRLHVSCEEPNAQSMNSGPQPKPPVTGTKIMLSQEASASAQLLADALRSEIGEVTVDGTETAWPFQQNIYAMKIIAGHKP